MPNKWIHSVLQNLPDCCSLRYPSSNLRRRDWKAHSELHFCKIFAVFDPCCYPKVQVATPAPYYLLGLAKIISRFQMLLASDQKVCNLSEKAFTGFQQFVYPGTWCKTCAVNFRAQTLQYNLLMARCQKPSG